MIYQCWFKLNEVVYTVSSEMGISAFMSGFWINLVRKKQVTEALLSNKIEGKLWMPPSSILHIERQ